MSRQIEIVFTKSKKKFPIFSWLIRLWTWKSYSHVARKMQIGFLDQPNYFQASEGQVNWEYHTHFDQKHEIVESISFPVTEQEYRLFNKTCWEQVGAKYGLKQNMGIVLCDILSLVGIKMSNPWKDGMNCSEVIYRTILKPKFGDLGYRPDKIKPHHIRRILKKYYNK